MIPVAVLDITVLFAGASERDAYHDRGQEIVSRIDHGYLPDVRVANYVLAEVLNLTRETLGPAAATEVLDRVIEGTHFEATHVRKADFSSAQALFRQYGGRCTPNRSTTTGRSIPTPMV